MVFDKILGNIDGGNILDVGCGYGQFIEILVTSLKSYTTVTGVDVDDDSLGEVRKKFPGENFRFLKAGSAELPFRDDAFDFVVISKALHHVEDAGASLAEMKRVLMAGGYFMINEMHRDQLTPAQESHMLYHHLCSDIDRELGISHNYTFHRDEIIRFADLLDLDERIIVEFSPQENRALDRDNIREFIGKTEDWMHSLDGHPQKQHFLERIKQLQHRFKQYGISRPPQMVILGKKS